MFDNLKIAIRDEVGGKKVLDVNDEISNQLRKIAKKAKQQGNLKKNIACYEMILEDLGMNNPNAFSAKTELLSEYNDCGFYNTSEALNLVLLLLKELNATNENLIIPMLHIPCIRPLYCAAEKNNKDLAKQYAISSFQKCIELLIQYGGGTDNINGVLLNQAHRELVKIYVYENNFEAAYDLFITLSKDNITSIDIVARCFLLIFDLYGFGGDDKYADQCLEGLKQMSNIPEANYMLGIIYAEGFKVTKNTSAAKEYFNKAKKLAKEYNGTVGYTDYEFKVLSPISASEILKNAEEGEYYSKFYYERERLKSAGKIKTNTSANKNSSGGCYVATCVYGSYDCPPVWTLRRFRDDILAHNVFGRLFIRFYYATSPTAVRLFGKQKWFHKLFKTPLDKFVKKLQENGVENTPYND